MHSLVQVYGIWIDRRHGFGIQQKLSIVIARDVDYFATCFVHGSKGLNDSLVAFNALSFVFLIDFLSENMRSIGLIPTYEYEVIRASFLPGEELVKVGPILVHIRA